MKSVITITALTLLFSLYTFSQDRIHRGVLPDKPTSERLREIHKPNVDDIQGLNNIESLPIKSENSDLHMALINPQQEFYEKEEFNAKDTRTTINKTLLSNGFLLIEEIYQTWDGSTWVNNSKYSYTYDGNNNLTEWLYQSWDGSVWVNSYKVSKTYDGNNNLTEELSQSWDGSAWVDNFKFSYIYDGNNNLTGSLRQSWDGSVWVNNFKYSYTYDGNNNRTELLYQTWNGSAWVNGVKESYTYDGNNNLTELLCQGWDGSVWVNSGKYSYTYDGNNNQTEYLFQNWDGSAWVNYRKFSYTYDGNNNLAEELSQSWDGSAWVNSGKNSYTYVPVTEVNEDLSSVNYYSLSNNYPNPFNPSTMISYTIPERSNVSLKIFNLLGSEVAELVKGEIEAGKYDISFNASALPSGVYFYRLQAGSFVESKKMILLK